MKKSTKIGQIYVVATPIGNLGDFSPRAQEILQQVDLIAAEDTRHSQKLLNQFGIKTTTTAYHEHNEQEKSSELLAKVQHGLSIALISDAGTPLISDPGYRLIAKAQADGIVVSGVPGPCAVIAALAISGMTADEFFFGGFLPAKSSQRRKRLQEFVASTYTCIFYESSHRILTCLEDLHTTLPKRQLVLARELTKTFETVLKGEAIELLTQLKADPNQQKGEFVLLIAGCDAKQESVDEKELERLLKTLLDEVSLKQAVKLACKITGLKKNKVYDIALNISQSSSP